MSRLDGAWRAWCRFWFETDGRAQMRVFGVGLGLLLFACYAIRSLDLTLFFGEHGLMPSAILPDVMPMDYRWSIFRVWTSDAALWAGNAVLLAGLLAMAFQAWSGKGRRWARATTLVVWTVHVSFVHRNLAVAYGVDTISCFYLFYLLFDDYRSDADYRAGDLRATLGSMAYRLCQIQLCIIYAYSGLKKLKGYTWWNGEAIWNSLADPQLARADFTYLAHFPMALAAVAYLTLAWETYFPALIWVKPLRKPMLVVGVALHLGIAIGLNLFFFGMLMMLTYVLFLEREDGKRLIGRMRRIFATRA
jgi:hypothetical protein